MIGTAKSGACLVSTHVGVLHAMVKTDTGRKVPFTLDAVYVVPDLERPLLSVDLLNVTGHSVRFEPQPVGAYILMNTGDRVPLVPRHGLRDLVMYDVGTLSGQANVAVTSKLRHQRLGHLGMDGVREVGELGVGVPRNLRLRSKCGVCETCKHKRVSFSQPIRRVVNVQPLEEIHMDQGQANVPSKGGKRWFMICTDKATRFRWVHFVGRKSDVKHRVVDLVRDIKFLGGNLKVIRCDSGGEFIGKSVVNWGKENGIRIFTGGPRAAEQNGIAERSNRTVVEMTRTLRKMAGFPTDFWVPAMNHAIYLLNRLPTSALDGDTPYHALHGTHADLSQVKTYGARSWFHVINRKKLDDKAKEGVYVGCDPNNPRRAHIYDPVAGKIRETVHYTIDEAVFPARSPSFGQPDYTISLDSEVLSDSDSDDSGPDLGPVGAQHWHRQVGDNGTGDANIVPPANAEDGDDNLDDYYGQELNQLFDDGNQYDDYYVVTWMKMTMIIFLKMRRYFE